MKFVFSFLCRSVILAFVALSALNPHPVFAACSSPSGIAGDIIYNGTYNVLQYCNGTNWINAGVLGVNGGTMTNGDFCTYSSGSSTISCATAQINLATQVTGNLPVANLPALNSSYLWVGNGSNVATAVAMSGDCTIASTGAITCTKTAGTAFGPLATASTVGIAQGGTNATGQTTNGVNYFNGTNITSGTGFVYTGTNVGIGTATPQTALAVNGTTSVLFGTNYATTGAQSDVAINTLGSVRYTGSGAATFNGIVAGTNGQILYLANGSTSTLTLANQSATDTTYPNQIVTGTGGNLSIIPNGAAILQYDATATNSNGASGAWRVIAGSGGNPGGANTQVQYNSSGAFAGTGNFSYSATNGALVVGTGAATPVGTSGTIATVDVNVMPQSMSFGTLGGSSGAVTLNVGTSGQAAYYSGTNTLASAPGLYISGSNVGIGTATPTAALTVNGTEAEQFGSNYTTTGTQNDVNLGSATSIRYTGTSTATFNGIVAGYNGQILYLHNGSTNTLTLANQSTSDTTYANQIVTGTGSSLSVASNSAVILQYDATATNSNGASGAWRVIGGSGSSGGGSGGSGTTSTMVPNWPDAIRCGTGSVPTILYLQNQNYSGLTYYIQVSNGNYGITYNATTQAYNSTLGWSAGSTVSDCEVSISAIYAKGQAFNFIGSALTSAASPANSLQYSNNGVLAGSGVYYTSSNGYVGIGTATPQANLEIHAGTNQDFAVNSNGSNTHIFAYNDAWTGYQTLQIDGNPMLLNPTIGSYVGIGTGVPNFTLTINGSNSYTHDGGTGGLAITDSTNPLKKIYMGFDDSITAGYLQSVYTGSVYEPLLLNPNGGNVGIGNTSPSYKLDVSGVIRSTGTMYVQGAPETSYYYYACFDGTLGFTYGNSCSGSDIRLKKDIKPIEGALDTVLKMKGVSFLWKDPKRGTGRQIGFIAQDMETVVPEVVNTGPDGTKGLDYQKLTAVLAEAIKQFKKAFDVDHDKLAADEAEIKLLKARLDKLETAQHRTTP